MGNLTMRTRIYRLQNKLKSQSGASITYALLLFLVCAVVSSVILAAGTAASGRISQAVETDRRYYAVTSAARLLKDVYEEYEICIEQKAEHTVSSAEKEYSTFAIKKRKMGEGYTKYNEAVDKIFTLRVAEAFVSTKHEPNPEVSGPYKLVISKDGKDVILVSFEEKLDVESGTITLDITSTGNETNSISTGDTDSYSLRMTFIPSIKVSDEVKMKENTLADEDDSFYIKKTQLSWRMISVEIINALNDKNNENGS